MGARGRGEAGKQREQATRRESLHHRMKTLRTCQNKIWHRGTLLCSQSQRAALLSKSSTLQTVFMNEKICDAVPKGI